MSLAINSSWIYAPKNIPLALVNESPTPGTVP